MKILAINGSPNRDGFTASLIDMLLAVCTKAGAACERVNITDFTIGECGDCKKCIKNGTCCQNDDYMQLKAKMLEADGIIIASPYYAGHPTEELKIFIDRLLMSSAYHGYFSFKYIIGLSTSAVNDPKKVARYCARMGRLGSVCGGIVSGLLYESTVTRMDIKEFDSDKEINDKVDRVGKKLMRDIAEKYVPPFYNMRRILLRGWRGLYTAKLLRFLDRSREKMQKIFEEKGWVKKANKFE